jgi:xylulokinase
MNQQDAILGIDIGTQSCKCVVLDTNGHIFGVGQQNYDVMTPHPQWAEQDPAVWWDALVTSTGAAMHQANLAPSQVCGIGLTGQMHGIVLIGQITNRFTQRSSGWIAAARTCAAVQARVSPEIVRRRHALFGFRRGESRVLAQHDPTVLDRTLCVLQPKDYAILRLTGAISSDPSDASGTWLYDVRSRAWSDDLAAACGVVQDKLPPVSASSTVVGTLRAELTNELGLRAGLPVVAGAGDQAALLTGTGVIQSGHGAITIGTGGQITVVSNQPLHDPELRLNTFAMRCRIYGTMGAILNGGMALVGGAV